MLGAGKSNVCQTGDEGGRGTCDLENISNESANIHGSNSFIESNLHERPMRKVCHYINTYKYTQNACKQNNDKSKHFKKIYVPSI